VQKSIGLQKTENSAVFRSKLFFRSREAQQIFQDQEE